MELCPGATRSMGAPWCFIPQLISICLVIKSTWRHLPFLSRFSCSSHGVFSSGVIPSCSGPFPLSLLACAGWEPSIPNGNLHPCRGPINGATRAQGRQERDRLISALPSSAAAPSLAFVLGRHWGWSPAHIQIWEHAGGSRAM